MLFEENDFGGNNIHSTITIYKLKITCSGNIFTRFILSHINAPK